MTAPEHDEVISDPALRALEVAWGLIANAGGGDWSLETPEWQQAAARWRDEHWHPLLKAATKTKTVVVANHSPWHRHDE